MPIESYVLSNLRHSTIAAAALMDRQKQINMPTKKLMQDCSMRWNSSQRLVDTRWPISAVLSDEQLTKRADQYLDLRNDQWDLAKELLAPLKQIETATVYISEEERASISSILPILYRIIENLSLTDEDSVIIKKFKMTVTE